MHDFVAASGGPNETVSWRRGEKKNKTITELMVKRIEYHLSLIWSRPWPHHKQFKEVVWVKSVTT